MEHCRPDGIMHIFLNGAQKHGYFLVFLVVSNKSLVNYKTDKILLIKPEGIMPNLKKKKHLTSIKGRIVFSLYWL